MASKRQTKLQRAQQVGARTRKFFTETISDLHYAAELADDARRDADAAMVVAREEAEAAAVEAEINRRLAAALAGLVG